MPAPHDAPAARRRGHRAASAGSIPTSAGRGWRTRAGHGRTDHDLDAQVGGDAAGRDDRRLTGDAAAGVARTTSRPPSRARRRPPGRARPGTAPPAPTGPRRASSTATRAVGLTRPPPVRVTGAPAPAAPRRDGVVGPEALQLGLRAQHQPVAEDGGDHAATSSGVTKSRPARRAAAFDTAEQVHRRARAGAERDARQLAGGAARRAAGRPRPRRDPGGVDLARARHAAPPRRRPAARRRACSVRCHGARGRSIASSSRPRRGSRRRPSSGSGRAGPRAAGRCPRTRWGSAWRRPGTGRAAGATRRRRSPDPPASPRAARPGSWAGCG